ncbi:MAG: 2-dehydropantoate 2-reductase [Ilumatobacteraceae bacterium]
MKIVVFGAGAVGSVIGGRLHQHRDRHGHDVVLVARGPHATAINADGLTIHDPSGTTVVDVPAVERVAEVPLTDGDVVVLSMKTQGTQGALDDLVAHAPAGITVACAQNGIENERLALRHFADVQGICVMLPAIFLDPGVVDTHGQPHNAILDVGSYPAGTSASSEALAAAFDAAGFASMPRGDVMRWKHTKLLANLRNVLDARIAEQDDPRLRDIARAARAEGIAVLEAAGLPRTTDEEERERRTAMKATRIPGRRDHGSSTYQSFARGDTSTEVDWLNGEVVLLGRLHGVPTPVNERLQRLAQECAARGAAPRSVPIADLLQSGA